MKQLSADLAAFWAQYAALVLFGAGLAGVIALIGLGVWAKKSRKPLRPIALAVSMNLALLLNAEGMWEVLTEKAGLPALFTALVFAVFEICFLTATSLAAEQYRRTTVLDAEGNIVTPGHPGAMLYVAALIAGLSGLIVATNAASGTEKLLRLAVPAVIFLMWWAALTAAGQRLRRSRFAYSPRRLAERWGWLIPDDDPDLVAMAAGRQVRRMVVAHQRVAAKRWPASWWRSRLLKDARTAGEPVVAGVVEQLARIERVMALLGPADRAPEPEMPRAADASESVGAPLAPAWLAARERAVRVRERLASRRVRSAHTVIRERTVQVPREDPRSAQQKELAVRAVKSAHPRLPQREIARVTDLPPSTVRDLLRAPRQSESARQVNGSKPDLEGVNS